MRIEHEVFFIGVGWKDWSKYGLDVLALHISTCVGDTDGTVVLYQTARADLKDAGTGKGVQEMLAFAQQADELEVDALDQEVVH